MHVNIVLMEKLQMIGMGTSNVGNVLKVDLKDQVLPINSTDIVIYVMLGIIKMKKEKHHAKLVHQQNI